MIINGYAFTQENKYIRVLNLNQLNHAAVIYDDKIVETNMDDIENQQVVIDLCKRKEAAALKIKSATSLRMKICLLCYGFFLLLSYSRRV